MTTTLDQGRGILGFLGPITGARATGNVMVTPDPAAFTAGVTSVPLAANTWLAPVLKSVFYPQIVYRVLPNYAAGANFWAVPQAGALVAVEAHVGGTRYNVPAGTPLRFVDFVPDGFTQGTATSPALVAGTGGLSGGTTESFYGPDVLNQVAIYESLGPTKMTLDLFRAQIGSCPSAMLVWNSTARPQFARRDQERYTESWSLMLFFDRADNDPSRRGQGLRVMDAAQDLLLHRTVYGDDGNTGLGGLIVSADPSITPTSRRRITGPEEVFKFLYVYAIGVDAIRISSRVDFRTFGPWNRTRLDVNFPIPQSPETNLPIVVDNEFDMPQGG